MTKQSYYHNVFGRANVLKETLLGLLALLSSAPRLLLEVFIRKNFGERYFKLSIAVLITLALAALPIAVSRVGIHVFSHPSFTLDYWGWYIYLIAFLILSIKHDRDIRRRKSTLEEAQFSQYEGDILPFFGTLQLPDKKTDTRRITTLFEPGLFLVAGIVLWLIGQKLGILLIVCSIIYSASYVTAYLSADNYILNKVDELICSENMEEWFLSNDDEDFARDMGKRKPIRYYGCKPRNASMRSQLLPEMKGDEPVTVAR